MILHVEFDQFSATVKRLLDTKEVYVRALVGATAVSAGHSSKNFVVGSIVRQPADSIRQALLNEGHQVYEGEWTDSGEAVSNRIGEQPTYLAAVAYVSREKMPGLWIDAYPSLPVSGLVLRSFYEELASNGEIGEVNFEEFVRLANPNVVIVGPNEIQSFLNGKENG
jgi:hypothetical protein